MAIHSDLSLRGDLSPKQSQIDCHDLTSNPPNDSDFCHTEAIAEVSQRKKRVIITLKDITERGGGERVGANLANAFARELGYEVQVLSFFRANATPCYALDSSVKCTYLRNRPAKAKNALVMLFNKTLLRVILCYQVHKIAKRINADIILANDGWFVPLFAQKKRVLSKNAKLVRLWHINAPKRARKKLRLFDTLVVLSPREIALWQRYHHNIAVIPNFLPQIPNKSTNHAQKVVLSVGRMDKGDQKGFLRLLDIWKIVQESIKNPLSKDCATTSSLRESASADSWQSTLQESKMDCREFDKSNSRNDTKPCHTEPLGEVSQNEVSLEKDNRDISGFALNMTKIDSVAFSKSQYNKADLDALKEWKLVIVGDGIMKSQIESKINDLGLQDSIILKPFTKEIEKEYLSASVYAMSSHWEGFPMVLLEACSYGLPCIAFDIATGPSDIIKHSKSGFLISDDDLEAYANHLLKLMSDESMRINFGIEAKRIVGERFSKEVIMEKWEEVFRELLKFLD